MFTVAIPYVCVAQPLGYLDFITLYWNINESESTFTRLGDQGAVTKMDRNVATEGIYEQ